MAHKCPWITGCSSLLGCVNGHLLRVLITILSNPLSLLFSFSITLGNCLVRALRQIVSVAWILNRSSSRKGVLSSFIRHVRITTGLVMALSVKGDVSIGWRHIAHLIGHDHFVATCGYYMHIVTLSLLLHGYNFLRHCLSTCLFGLLLLDSICCQVTIGHLLLHIYTFPLPWIRLLSHICLVLH